MCDHTKVKFCTFLTSISKDCGSSSARTRGYLRDGRIGAVLRRVLKADCVFTRETLDNARALSVCVAISA